MTVYQEKKLAQQVHQNPPERWREVWADRQKIRPFATLGAALRFAERKQPVYKETLKVGLHPKDGYVVFHEQQVTDKK